MNNNEENTVRTKTHISWYPGHMAKTRRQIKEYIKQVDVVFELLDARIPFSSRIKDIKEIIGNKPALIIMTKWDLCDQTESGKWVKYYEGLGFKVIKYDLTKNIKLDELITATNVLIKEKTKKRELKGLKPRRTRAIIIGIPNVGKSTLINRLVGKKVTKIGNKPGITKTLDWIRISATFELLDTPGILWPNLDDKRGALNLASLTAIKENVIPIPDVVEHIMLMYKQYYAEFLNLKYGITTNNFADYINIIGKKRGCLLKGGIIDKERVNLIILNDLKSGLVKGITFDRYNM